MDSPITHNHIPAVYKCPEGHEVAGHQDWGESRVCHYITGVGGLGGTVCEQQATIIKRQSSPVCAVCLGKVKSL